jgi:selenocysteine lyase/cysteine desulfurase
MDKRSFIKKGSLIGLGALIAPNILKSESIGSQSHNAMPDLSNSNEEVFWQKIRGFYDLKTDYINLENGYYCIQPKPILEAFQKHVTEVNRHGAYYMRTVQFENKKRIAAKLAELAGCEKDELIITRNTTESLNMIIGGLNWKTGDEAVMADQDYGAMLDMFAQIGKRYGVKNKLISIPNHPKSDEEIVALYEKAITPKTKLLMVCHMINITGQILPVRKICDMAKKKGVLVMVDGAHAFAHFQYKISELNCDFYGCSLHKWLSSPLGAGFLYVRKEHVSKVWPLFAESEMDEKDIYRLNHTGTIPVHTDLAIENAIEFYMNIGADIKENRLRFLQQYWTSKVRTIPKIILNTPAEDQRACAIANVGVEGIKPAQLADLLLKKYGIYTVAIDGKGVHGVRVTPNLYTATAELDKLVKALEEIAST